ncbi:RelA/SpoT family protein [Helicovermis profundi]|uniref:GTP diphosphokinase n=1 Tax=Helicovermis profundi TaxID=3065157 RepID=A0AAU9EHX1_9FIRM|nr:bifunctional (p)ppGpp synthetase/guanosine-3',5'-bis(diphosphate) 3'-pyrophosphohydrolase [Clostridia bacterium S502]
MNLESYVLKLQQLNSSLNIEKIVRAYTFAEEAHRGQLRKSGEKYFIHPVHVSLILAELELDEDTIISGLLHDVVEDTKYIYKDIKDEFGEDVANMVDGVTKLGKINYESKEEQQAENLRKMFIAMAKDIRVILIKLADRLHNMRTLKFMPDEKKKEKALETLEIYAPIAHRLGISKIKWELEDLSFLYLEPESYYNLVTRVNKKRDERLGIINKVISDLEYNIKLVSINCDIYGRPKNFYSIYKKMTKQNKDFDEIYDLTAIRVIVDSIKDCYGVLGIIHSLWKPIPGRFKDYIAMPKPNMYQSIHTTVIGNTGEPFEIQIRTWDMHRIAEYGIAAHWKYKEGKSEEDNMEEKLSWLRQMMEWQKDLNDPKEFMDSLKLDLFTNEVFVFTPDGKVIDLPMGSTPVDFAYKIHSQVGNRCVGAKVNGRIVPLNFKVSNGQIIEILTAKNSNGPSRDWLKFVKSNQAKNKIRHWFKKERREENIEKGSEAFFKEIKKSGYTVKELVRPEWVEPLLDKLSCNNMDDLYAAIGYGGIMLSQVLPKLRDKYKFEQKELNKSNETDEELKGKIKERNSNKKIKSQAKGISVKGVDNLLIRYAKCCNPVPGDDIIGYITRGRGVTVHRSDCTNFEKTDDSKSRFIEVEWDTGEVDSSYAAQIQVIAPDRKGLLGELTVLISEMDLFVTGINAKITKNEIAVINLNIEINNAVQLNKLINKLKGMPKMIDVKRITS